MPIYAYKCSSCGHAKDVLQKLSDSPLSVCPECGLETFSKQVTAAGFQLKGSGWYVTDFKDGGAKKSDGSAVAPAKTAADAVPSTSSSEGSTASSTSSSSDSGSSATTSSSSSSTASTTTAASTSSSSAGSASAA